MSKPIDPKAHHHYDVAVGLRAVPSSVAAPQPPCEHEWVMQMIPMPNYDKPGATKCSKCGAFKPSEQFSAATPPSEPPADICQLDLEPIKRREAAAIRGPWQWVVSLKSKEARLEAAISGFEVVMDFVRWGMGGAKPRFQRKSLMVDAEAFATTVKGREHHSTWYQTIDHPDAQFIAHARTDVPALIAEVERLRAALRASGAS